MKQDSRSYEDSLTNERLFAGSQSQFDVITRAIDIAQTAVNSGKDAINPAYETLKSIADGKELCLPDRQKRAPMEIIEEERRSPSRSKREALLKS